MNWDTYHITERLRDIKYYACPHCGAQAIVLTALETEQLPERDENGHYQYHCIAYHRYFSVDAYQSIFQEKGIK